jgi:spore germination protein GerM
VKRIFYFILLLTLSCAASAETMKVSVYLGNSDKDPNGEYCDKVYPASRNVSKTKNIAATALNELFKGVTQQETGKKYHSMFSAETANILISLKIRKNSAYINLKSTARQPLSSASTSCGRDMFFAQIEKTLQHVSPVKNVFFAMDGKPTDFYDWMELECPEALGKCEGKEFR